MKLLELWEAVHTSVPVISHQLWLKLACRTPKHQNTPWEHPRNKECRNKSYTLENTALSNSFKTSGSTAWAFYSSNTCKKVVFMAMKGLRDELPYINQLCGDENVQISPPSGRGTRYCTYLSYLLCNDAFSETLTEQQLIGLVSLKHDRSNPWAPLLHAKGCFRFVPDAAWEFTISAPVEVLETFGSSLRSGISTNTSKGNNPQTQSCSIFSAISLNVLRMVLVHVFRLGITGNSVIPV